jgi:hypothetical protein
MSILPELESSQAGTGFILTLASDRTKLAMARRAGRGHDIDFMEQRHYDTAEPLLN